MAGPTSLRSQKALLTRYCNNLNALLEKYAQNQHLGNISFQNAVTSQEAQALVYELNATSKLVDQALSSFTIMVDSLIDQLDEEQVKQANEYIDKAHLAIERAHCSAIELDARRLSARDHALRGEPLVTQNEGNVGIARPKLQAIPIPIFSGKVWEFENFWTLFEANVHKQPLSRLQKFNYLISALRGEARESARIFTVTEANYEHALQFLRTKYGDESRLIDSLQSRLENARAGNVTLEGQRRLLEHILPIVTQLEEKGVPLDSSFLTQKVLSKFKVSLQRKVLENCLSSPSQQQSWTLNDILADLDKVIATEERINYLVDRSPSFDKPSQPQVSRFSGARNQAKGVAPCIFCGATDHKPLVHAHTVETTTTNSSEPMENENPSLGTVLSTIKGNNAYREGYREGTTGFSPKLTTFSY
ncbi:hypothetical protein ANCCAN_27860 [Ancylostoma caninum]|uniref:Uncharacterized protein n=1 Tax=Ancylostoma caninum TaxID=29170 RepID=A0A368F2U0_ANCCA|nr:hypothetical protein ANCCAN_27860 [Ancylostoma caninum]